MIAKDWETEQTLYADQDVQINLLDVLQEGVGHVRAHYRKCACYLVYRGVLLLDVIGRETRYLRADTGACFVPAGMPHGFLALSDVRAIVLYRARPDETIDPQDVRWFTTEDTQID